MREQFEVGGKEMAECVCPECSVIHWKRLDVSYIVKSDIQKKAGYIVLLCIDCGKSIIEEK